MSEPSRHPHEIDPKVGIDVALNEESWEGVDWVVKSVVNATATFTTFVVHWEGWGPSWCDELVLSDCASSTAKVDEYLKTVPCWGGGQKPMRFKTIHKVSTSCARIKHPQFAPSHRLHTPRMIHHSQWA